VSTNSPPFSKRLARQIHPVIRMVIRELILNNFGVYKGVHKIPLNTSSRTKPIILFGGLNGTGKTTLLDALQLVLYGRNAKCSNRANLPYEEFLRRCINRSAGAEEGASLEIEFTRNEYGEQNTYHILRRWRENGRTPREYVEVSKNGQIDSFLTETWLEQIEDYLPSKIAHFFFFDGEKIEEFADIANASVLLSSAIQSLLGVDMLDRLGTDLTVFERRQRGQLKKDHKTTKDIEDFQTRLEELELRKQELLQLQAGYRNQLDRTENRLRGVEDGFRQEGGELFEQREQLESTKQALTASISDLENQLREIAAGSAPLLLVPQFLSKIERQSERERLSTRSKILNTVLSERDEALLETVRRANIKDEAINIISSFLELDRKTRQQDSLTDVYLDLDSQTVKALQDVMGVSGQRIKIQIEDVLSKLEKLRSEEEDIDRRLTGIPAEEFIVKLIEERETLKGRLEEVRLRIKMAGEDLEHIKNKYQQKHAQMVSLIEKAVEADFDRGDSLRILRYSAKVRETLDVFRSSVVRQHVEQISALVLDAFVTLCSKESFVRQISIDPETFALELRGPDGKAMSTDRLSAGERQLLAVSMLWGLARASGRPFPTAIDTPLGRLDSLHRLRLVEKYFPQAGHQVLLFSTDEEINGEYLKKLEPFIERTYLLEYNQETASTKINSGYY
jgi:DNA sulfur modification protein DndD